MCGRWASTWTFRITWLLFSFFSHAVYICFYVRILSQVRVQIIYNSNFAPSVIRTTQPFIRCHWSCKVSLSVCSCWRVRTLTWCGGVRCESWLRWLAIERAVVALLIELNPCKCDLYGNSSSYWHCMVVCIHIRALACFWAITCPALRVSELPRVRPFCMRTSAQNRHEFYRWIIFANVCS